MMRLKEQQSGFAMIEALIAAVLLVIVTLGVLLGLDAAQRSSGREKSRSVAAALTEQDQERLRSFRAVDLDNYDQTRTVKVNKIPYVIASQADWVRDSTGGTESCNSNTVQADYMRVTSTTTSGLINSPIAPIKMSSLVAPPIGAFGTNQGTLGVQVNNRDGVGVAGVPVTIVGPATLSNPTNSAGCAIFAYVPVGAYNASVTQTGWVDPGGNPTAQKGATVTSGTVNVTTLAYDNAASVAVSFDTETLSGATVPASSTQVALANSGVPSGPFSPFGGLRVVDPAGGRGALHHRHRPVPVRRRLRRLRRRLPGRRPDEVHLELLRPQPQRLHRHRPGPRVSAGHGAAAVDQPQGDVRRRRHPAHQPAADHRHVEEHELQ